MPRSGLVASLSNRVPLRASNPHRIIKTSQPANTAGHGKIDNNLGVVRYQTSGNQAPQAINSKYSKKSAKSIENGADISSTSFPNIVAGAMIAPSKPSLSSSPGLRPHIAAPWLPSHSKALGARYIG